MDQTAAPRTVSDRRTVTIPEALFLLSAGLLAIGFWIVVLAVVFAVFGVPYTDHLVTRILTLATLVLGPASAIYFLRRLRDGRGAALRGCAALIGATIALFAVGALVVVGSWLPGPLIGTGVVGGWWWVSRQRARATTGTGLATPNRQVHEPLDAEARRLLEEAIAVVKRFEAVRDRFRGRLAAPVSDLPDERECIADALVTVARASGSGRKRRLAGDLLELLAFVGDEDAATLEAYRRSQSDRGKRADLAKLERERAERLLDELRVTRATMARELRDDYSVVGDYVALGNKPIAIGDGRTALDAVRDYRDSQVVGFLGAYVAIGGAFVAAYIGEAWLIVLLVGWLSSVLGVLVASGVAIRIDRWLRARATLDSPFQDTIDVIREAVELIGGLGLPIAAMAAVIAAT